jgi:hypothetical protein
MKGNASPRAGACLCSCFKSKSEAWNLIARGTNLIASILLNMSHRKHFKAHQREEWTLENTVSEQSENQVPGRSALQCTVKILNQIVRSKTSADAGSIEPEQQSHDSLKRCNTPGISCEE